MSATTIIDTAPLGALIRYTDGSPKPPARFTKKLAAWERSNGIGRLVKKEPPRPYPTWTAPASFTLHEGNFSSDGVIQIGNHSAYKERELRIEYPWHPLFGRVLRARDGGRRQGAGSVLVEDRPGFFRTLPPWMCDPGYCARLDSGPPLVAIAALETLARTLELMRDAQVAPSSGTLIPEEDMHAPSPPNPPAAGSTLPGTGRSPQPPTSGTINAGTSGGLGRTPADGCAEDGGLGE